MEHALLYIIMACAFAFFMAWGMGANDVANVMGTSVGSKSLSIKQAILVAAIFEAAGSMLAGGQVTNTIRGKLIDVHLLAATPELLIFGMLAALLAAGSWLLIASYFGWPVSTTHSIIGAVVGFGAVALGTHFIYWRMVSSIAISWLVTPVIAAVGAYLLFISVQRLIFNTQDPVRMAKRYVPLYIFMVALIISLVTMFVGIKHLGVVLTDEADVIIAVAFSLVAAVFGVMILRRFSISESASRREKFAKVEKIFAVLMIFTACAMAFAHGSNDVANAVGPLTAVLAIVKTQGDVTAHVTLPVWVLALGAVGIVLGLAMYGYKVMATVGSNITQLTPSRGFAAQLATAATVVAASGVGMPVSTTQILVGAVLGVGFARGIGALNLAVVRNIFMSWIITLPAGAILSIIYFYIIKLIFLG